MSKIFKQVFRPSTTQKDGAYFTSSDDRLWLKSGRKVEAALEGVGCGLITSQWNLDKTAIAEALTLQGVPTLATESGEAMARKILDLQLAVEDDPASYTAPIEFSDLFEVCHNNQRPEYNGMFAVRATLASDILLSGADAYLTSSGHFYTSDTTHTWEVDDFDRWVIFYSLSGELNINFGSAYTYTIQEIVAYKGKITSMLLEGLQLTQVLISDKCERYGTTGNTIYNTAIRSYVDMARESATSYLIYGSGGANLWLPNLKTASVILHNIGGSSLRDLYLPNLEQVGTLLSSTNSVTNIYCPKLKLSTGALINGTQSALRVLDLPLLEEARSYVLSNVTGIETLSLPSLKIQTGGVQLVHTTPALTTLDLPQLETCASLAITANALTEDGINIPKLHTHMNTLFQTCPSIEHLNIPSLFRSESIFTINCTGLKTIDLLNLEYIQTPSNVTWVNNCPELESVEIPNVHALSGGSASNQSYAMFYNCPKLTELRLPNVHTITRILFGLCPNVKYLFLGKRDNLTDSGYIHESFIQFSNVETLELEQGFRKSISLRYWTTFKDGQTIIDYVFNRIADTGKAITLTISTAIRDAVGTQAITDLTIRTGITVTVV